MILIPQYRTARRAAVTALQVQVVQSASAFIASSSGTFSFPGTPSDGNRIVLFCARPSVSSIVRMTQPSGFSTIQEIINTPCAASAFTKIASAETNSYTITNTAGANNQHVIGYEITACSVGDSGVSTDDTTGTSLTIPSSALDVSDKSLCIAFRTMGTNPLSSTAGSAFTNSFVSIISVSSNGISVASHREYASSSAAQQTVSSWDTSHVQRRGIFVEFLP